MAVDDITTDAESPMFTISRQRADAILHAGYELEALALRFPTFQGTSLADEQIQNMFIRRIKELSHVVWGGIDDDMTTEDLCRIVGLDA